MECAAGTCRHLPVSVASSCRYIDPPVNRESISRITNLNLISQHVSETKWKSFQCNCLADRGIAITSFKPCACNAPGTHTKIGIYAINIRNKIRVNFTSVCHSAWDSRYKSPTRKRSTFVSAQVLWSFIYLWPQVMISTIQVNVTNLVESINSWT